MSARGKKVTGAIEYIRGKLERAMGRATGSRSAQARGIGHQVKGGSKYEAGKAQDKVK